MKTSMARPKLTPEELHTTISDGAQFIAGRVGNITEFALNKGNKNLSSALAEGTDILCENFNRALFNLGNSETSEITPELKEQMRDEIENGERCVLLPNRIVRIRDELGDVRLSFQLRDKPTRDAFTNEELDRIDAMEDIVKVSRLLALGCAGLELPDKQRLSALELLEDSKNLVLQFGQNLRGKTSDFYYDGLIGYGR
jgi:hypothetical protein